MSDIPHDGGSAISIQKIKAKISARAVAGQQFMIIVIGLGITAAIGKFAELFKNPSDVPSEDQVFILAVFLIYATRFFFNNWLYLSESYDLALLDDLQDIIKRRSIKTKYFMTILRCVNFDIGLAIFTGLACALTGTLVFIESVHTPVVVALVVHYLFDATILAHNILSRWLERPAEYAFNLTRVVFLVWQQSFICSVVCGVLDFCGA